VQLLRRSHSPSDRPLRATAIPALDHPLQLPLLQSIAQSGPLEQQFFTHRDARLAVAAVTHSLETYRCGELRIDLRKCLNEVAIARERGTAC
jgi:hypothetical protein